MPATSSITTRAGSLPQIGSTLEEDHTPIKVIKMVIITETKRGGQVPAHARYQHIQQAIAATVPPPLPIYPIPRLVENSLWKSIVLVG